jgi:lysophospholipase L1-like esterase
MESSRAWRYSGKELLVIFALLLCVSWFYRGFFFPDPYTVRPGARLATLLLWCARLGIPLGVCVVGFLYHKTKTGRIGAVQLTLLAAATMSSLLLCLSLVSHRYERSFRSNWVLDQFHPYLQLRPRESGAESLFEADTFQIVCLGGSTTEFGDSRGRTWPVRVQRILRKELNNKEIKVYNQGRRWYTTLHSLVNYAANLRQSKPDLIIVMHTINDLLHNADFCYFSSGPFRQDYGHFYGPVSRIIRRPSLTEFAWKKFRALWYHKPRTVIEQEVFPGEKAFRRNLETLIDLAEKDRTRVVLVTQPSLYVERPTAEVLEVLYMLNFEAVGPDSRWSYQSAYHGFRRYADIVQDIAKNRGALLIDLEKRIPKTLEYFWDDVHYQDQTFEVIAEHVAERLISSGLLPRDVGSGQ